MADHLSDEQQLEALKKWWQKNGFSLMLILVLAGGGWFGWSYWQKQQEQTAREASAVYMALLEALSQWEADPSGANADRVAGHGETLKKLDDNGLYGQLAALAIARLAVADGDYDEASAELRWALEGSDDEAARSLIHYRLALMEFARGNGDEALALLDEPHAQQFDSLYQELRGDILADRGDDSQAKAAYEAALTPVGESQARALLELKINQVTPHTADNTDVGEDDA